MIAASIDIGTNTVLLLVAEIQKGRIEVLEEKQRIPRLGKGVDKLKNLDPNSMERVLTNLKEYRYYLQEHYPDALERTIVTATSAVRDASNKDEFLDLVEKMTSWKIQLLSGPKEAETTYRGALSVLEDRKEKFNLILDIGGGSSELAFGKGYELKNAVSMDMGSVRFTERFFKSDPPDSEQIDKARSEIRKLLNEQRLPEEEFDLVGVAGTITSIAGIDVRLDNYDTEKLNQYRLKKDRVENFIEQFANMNSEEIEREYSEFLKGRGEVILAGILILKEVMEWAGKDTIITSTGGIRHGILLK